MKRVYLWLILAAIVVVALLMRRRDNLNVEPHAREEIEKAKKR